MMEGRAMRNESKKENRKMINRKMNRRTVLIVSFLMLMAMPLKAQVFIQEDEFEGVLRSGYEDFGLIVPYEAGDADQFLPLGDGLLVLAALGGAYLIGKRKKE